MKKMTLEESYLSIYESELPRQVGSDEYSEEKKIIMSWLQAYASGNMSSGEVADKVEQLFKSPEAHKVEQGAIQASNGAQY